MSQSPEPVPPEFITVHLIADGPTQRKVRLDASAMPTGYLLKHYFSYAVRGGQLYKQGDGINADTQVNDKDGLVNGAAYYLVPPAFGG